MLNGSLIWRTLYVYVDLGAANEGYLPYVGQVIEHIDGWPQRTGWRTTRWDLRFVGLLNALKGVDRMFDAASLLASVGPTVHDAGPLGDL